MRIIGMILSLGAVMWVLYQSAGGGDAETVIPEGQQAALDKAKNLESSMQEWNAFLLLKHSQAVQCLKV